MDDTIKYDDFLAFLAVVLWSSLERSNLPFDLSGRNLHTVLITYVFDDYSTEVTQVDY